MLWTIIGLLIAAFLLYTLWKATKGVPYTLETIPDAINGILRRGYNGGFLVINIPHSKYFLQLRKYIGYPGDYGILLAFPRAPWSEGLFPSLIEFCKGHQLAYSIETEQALKPLEFLHIDFGKDAAEAHKVIKGIILEVFDLDESTKLLVTLQNASVKDELIDKNTPR